MKVRKYISRWFQLSHEHVLSCSSHFKTYLGKSLGPSRSLGSPNTDLKMSLMLTMPLRTNIPYKHRVSSVHWKILRRFVHTKHNFTLRHVIHFQGLLKIKARGIGLGRAGRGKMADGPRSPKSPKTPQISPLSPRQNNAESC